MNATALVSGDRIEVWGSVQAQTAIQNVMAHIAGTTPDKVAVNTSMLGGGLGRRSEVDFVLDAVLLAKAIPGEPVKVMWTREDDVQNGKYRPLTVNRRPTLTPRSPGRSITWLADRRREPTPINTLDQHFNLQESASGMPAGGFFMPRMTPT